MVKYHLVACRGRDKDGLAVLKKPVIAKVRVIHQKGSPDIKISAKCAYGCGYEGRECSASSENSRKLGFHSLCPYHALIPEVTAQLYGRTRDNGH